MSLKKKMKGMGEFMEGMELLQKFLTAATEGEAEQVIEDLRNFRQTIHQKAAEGELNDAQPRNA